MTGQIVSTLAQNENSFDQTEALALFKDELDDHIAVAQLTQLKLNKTFTQLVERAVYVLRNGGKIMFFGNGGSAADAQHLATELTVKFSKKRRALAAIALTTDTSALTAIGNDFGFDYIFSRQIEALGKPGDMVIAISTSGTSPNIIEGLKIAAQLGIYTTAFGGKDGGDMLRYADPILIVPSHTTSRIQEMHITLGQILCSSIEHYLNLV